MDPLSPPTTLEGTLPPALQQVPWRSVGNLMLTLPDRWGQHTRLYWKCDPVLPLDIWNVAWMQAPGRPLSDACHEHHEGEARIVSRRLPQQTQQNRRRRRR